MLNIRTISGLILCVAGILLVKLQNFTETKGMLSILFSCSGILVAFSGLAFFASGLKKRVLVKVKVCPNCFHKNDYGEPSCRRCNKPFP